MHQNMTFSMKISATYCHVLTIRHSKTHYVCSVTWPMNSSVSFRFLDIEILFILSEPRYLFPPSYSQARTIILKNREVKTLNEIERSQSAKQVPGCTVNICCSHNLRSSPICFLIMVLANNNREPRHAAMNSMCIILHLLSMIQQITDKET